ncbi:MAG TPA: hypothetical protein DHW71_12665 [Gammaproteobacteria bacterium]|nr:hypothetical protein [Gammaproteobacteria bacterium]HBF09066.1 hypothetical protein [Gammaproteobacteria bacterium]HCK93842.1 hypothetical protein [Gammaproteobacteria bacterium]
MIKLQKNKTTAFQLFLDNATKVVGGQQIRRNTTMILTGFIALQRSHHVCEASILMRKPILSKEANHVRSI